MADIKLELATPTVPNFIIIKVPAVIGCREFKESPKITLGELTDEQLNQICAEWKDNLFKRAYEQRKLR